MNETLPHRWSLAHNHLAGLTAGNWWRLLRENKFAVDPTYWHRAAFITCASVLNSCCRWREDRRYAEAIAQVRLTEAPLFILGHWRSGTTHLHNLLSQDTAQFAFPNTYQVVNPHTFLCSEQLNTSLFARLLPDKRPMDNVELRFDSPQEDELALCLMTRLSPYLSISFPRHHNRYEQYLTFSDVPPAEMAAWKAAFVAFVKRLTWKYGRRLLLKSPPHTARIRILSELFPGARFVHIHREPYTMFRSSQHYFNTAAWFTYLQRPNRAAIDDQIIRRHQTMYEAFFAERALIPSGRFHEVGFEELERDPIATMAGIYEGLALPGFGALEPRLQRYLQTLEGYRKNQFNSLPDALRRRVATAWSRSFDEWRYPV